MSELIGCKLEYPLSPDFRLANQIHVYSTCELPVNLILAPFILVLQAIEKQMEKESHSFDIGTHICCIFSNSDSFTVQLDPEQTAIYIRIAFYPLPRLQPFYGTKVFYMILAEELCHLIWGITDETFVSFKVFEVLQNIFPDLEMHQIYSQEIAAQYQKWVAEQPSSSQP